MRVEVDLPNEDSALYPGMYATVVLNVALDDDAPRVPDDALIFRNGATYAPVVHNNRIHLAKIALGNDDGREVEISNGLSPGALIAVNVGEGVEDGDPVQPVVLDSVGHTIRASNDQCKEQRGLSNTDEHQDCSSIHG